ncbi:thermonuclease family protein [Cloacibacterium caeni]|uniref:thermonuclease family protein n=1 Tax=Cloacibacterium caeni TaxID=2004710 RepID=UPI001BCED498|nr:thermonuclease family protein [Cloacibacterium caeni]
MKNQLIFLFSFLFFFAQAQLQENTWYKVSKITDGDTFYVMTKNSEKFKIRLIGIDAPESYNVGKKFRKEYFGKEAKVFATNLLKNKKVKLTFDVQKTDRYGRILAYAYLENGVFLNQYLVENGFAVVATFPPNVKFVEVFTKAEKSARNKKLGLWK